MALTEQTLLLQHEDAISHPHTSLRRGREAVSAATVFPIVFSPSRGDLPVLTSSSCLDVEQTPIYVVANSGAQLMNSLRYPYRRIDQESRQITGANEKTSGPAMLAYTKPGDTFVFASENYEISRQVLTTIAASFSEIGIELSRDFLPVASTDSWLDSYAGDVPILPNVLEPELVSRYTQGQPEDQARRIVDLSLAGVAAYTKHGIQQLWERMGVPTPDTGYFNLQTQTPKEITAGIIEKFGEYSEFVINRIDGSGGYGILFVPLNEIESSLQSEMFDRQEIQVQGLLPNKLSPCLIANIAPDGSVKILVASKQIFSAPGAHAGNYWEETSLQSLSELAPDFVEVNMQALHALSQMGIRGQVNVDSLILSAEDAEKYGMPTTVMREANIRPAGSSVICRMKEGNIDGTSIATIQTTTDLKISNNDFFNQDFLRRLNKHASPGKTHVVVYNYNSQTGKASLGFVGDKSTSEEDLVAMKKKLAIEFA